MNNDTKTTILGITKAIIWWAFTYSWTGLNIHSPLTWIGIVKGVVDVVNGYFTNKS